MFKVVTTIFQQIMTELNGAESEEDRIMAITNTVLELMGTPHEQTHNCPTVTKIWS
jgi:hypothetical protein